MAPYKWTLAEPLKNRSFDHWNQVTGSKFVITAGISIGDTTVKIATAIRALGVTVDQHLTSDDHVTKVVSSCNFHIRSLRHIRHLIDCETANTTACSIFATRLYYCNAVLYGITGKNIMRLQRVQDSLTRAVCAVPFCSSSVPLLCSLYWLPLRHRIIHKVASSTTNLTHPPLPDDQHLLSNSSATIVRRWSTGEAGNI